jgi:hypothetical protein
VRDRGPVRLLSGSGRTGVPHDARRGGHEAGRDEPLRNAHRRSADRSRPFRRRVPAVASHDRGRDAASLRRPRRRRDDAPLRRRRRRDDAAFDRPR